ncbi:MAG: hypothetical protein ACRDP6_34155 [Actinoallomurus sp.]
MRTTITKATAGIAAVALMAGGGVALASSGGSAKAAHATAGQVKPAGAVEQSAPDTDNIQSGDQTSPDALKASSGHSQESGSESGSEVTNNDGPGGHADEPANANADHQHQGQE